MFVIGNIGDSAGRSIRIGTMSAPQVDPANVDRLVAELTRAVNKSFAAVGKGD
jgi:aspartate aminotransferase-like enzyme